MATYLIGPSSTIDPRRPDLVLPLLSAASWPLFLMICFSYLSAQKARRNEARNHRIPRGWNLNHDNIRQARRSLREAVRPRRRTQVQGAGAPQQAFGLMGGRTARKERRGRERLCQRSDRRGV